MKYLISGLIAICLVFITDCTCATSEWKAGKVVDKRINPAYTTTSTDSKGRISTDYHPPEYYLITDVGWSTGRVSVMSWTYDEYRIGETCDVQFRHGRIMTYGFFAIRKNSDSW